MANEYVLKKDGRCLRRPFELTVAGEVEINLEDAIVSSLPIQRIHKAHKIGMIDDMSVGLCTVGDTEAFVSMRLSELTIKATVAVEEKMVTPSFQASGDVATLHWTPPSDMRLMFAVHCVYAPSYRYWVADTHYLFALDEASRGFILPLPNIYADAHLCTGLEETTRHNSVLDVMLDSFSALKASQWTDHLINEAYGAYANSQRMFVFTPTKEGFTQVAPILVDWKQLCRAVGSAVMGYLVL